MPHPYQTTRSKLRQARPLFKRGRAIYLKQGVTCQECRPLPSGSIEKLSSTVLRAPSPQRGEGGVRAFVTLRSFFSKPSGRGAGGEGICGFTRFVHQVPQQERLPLPDQASQSADSPPCLTVPQSCAYFVPLAAAGFGLAFIVANASALFLPKS